MVVKSTTLTVALKHGRNRSNFQRPPNFPAYDGDRPALEDKTHSLGRVCPTIWGSASHLKMQANLVHRWWIRLDPPRVADNRAGGAKTLRPTASPAPLLSLARVAAAFAQSGLTSCFNSDCQTLYTGATAGPDQDLRQPVTRDKTLHGALDTRYLRYLSGARPTEPLFSTQTALAIPTDQAGVCWAAWAGLTSSHVGCADAAVQTRSPSPVAAPKI